MTAPAPDEVERADAADEAVQQAAVAEAGVAAQVATLAVLAAVVVAVSAVLAGGSLTAATAALEAAAARAAAGLVSRASRAAAQALRTARRRGQRRARAELAALLADDLGIPPSLLDPHGATLAARIRGAAGVYPASARRLLQVALAAADLAGPDPAARAAAAQQALDRAVGRGAVTVLAPDGRRWRADAYLRRVTDTAALDARLDEHHAWLRANGVDIVSVTTNPQQCPRCLPWEGKLLALTGDGRRVVARGLDGTVHVVDVAGTVAQARAAGLLHPNCAHRLVGWAPGLTRTIHARPPDEAAATAARRRVLQRHVRMWEQRRAAALTPVARAYAARRLQWWRAELDGLDGPGSSSRAA